MAVRVVTTFITSDNTKFDNKEEATAYERNYLITNRLNRWANNRFPSLTQAQRNALVTTIKADAEKLTKALTSLDSGVSL
jgi:dsDNA-binding SOS-regulon protein